MILPGYENLPIIQIVTILEYGAEGNICIQERAK